jgi:hypothetical protein
MSKLRETHGKLLSNEGKRSDTDWSDLFGILILAD